MSETDCNVKEAMRLPAVLDLAAAESLLAMLLQQVTAGQPLRLDASEVETLTLPCIQVILSATRTYDRVSVEMPSIGFTSAFADLALGWEEVRAPAPVLHEAPTAAPAPEGDRGGDEDRTDPRGVPIGALNGEQAPVRGSDHGGDGERVDQQCRARADEQTGEEAMPKKILTIDDSKTMRDMLLLTLADAGFDVLQAVDGQEGIEVLGDQRVDVVITDINMPKMDGYEVIRCLRRNPIHKSTPILVLTTESDTEKRNLARAAGATGWMVKPFDPERLVATIRRVSP